MVRKQTQLTRTKYIDLKPLMNDGPKTDKTKPLTNIYHPVYILVPIPEHGYVSCGPSQDGHQYRCNLKSVVDYL